MNRTAIVVVAVAVAMLAGAFLAPPLPDAYELTIDSDSYSSLTEAETPVPYSDLTAREQRAFRAALSGDGRSVLYADEDPPHFHGGESAASTLTVVRYQGEEYPVWTQGPGLPLDHVAVTTGLEIGGLLAALSGVTALLSGHESRRLRLVATAGGLAAVAYLGSLFLPRFVPWLAVVLLSLLTALLVAMDLSGRYWPRGAATGDAG